jgi:inhibitor of KinA sporulation pathway (predicted exonuclease)
MRVIEEFGGPQRLVRPHQLPLTRFCSILTSISTEQVAAAQPFASVLQTHTHWLLRHCGSLEHVGFVSSGDWIFTAMIPAECQRHGLPVPEHLTRWINMKRVFELATGLKVQSMASMLAELTLPTQGKLHSGLDNCRNLANVVLALIDEGVGMHQMFMDQQQVSGDPLHPTWEPQEPSRSTSAAHVHAPPKGGGGGLDPSTGRPPASPKLSILRAAFTPAAAPVDPACPGSLGQGWDRAAPHAPGGPSRDLQGTFAPMCRSGLEFTGV